MDMPRLAAAMAEVAHKLGAAVEAVPLLHAGRIFSGMRLDRARHEAAGHRFADRVPALHGPACGAAAALRREHSRRGAAMLTPSS